MQRAVCVSEIDTKLPRVIHRDAVAMTILHSHGMLVHAGPASLMKVSGLMIVAVVDTIVASFQWLVKQYFGFFCPKKKDQLADQETAVPIASQATPISTFPSPIAQKVLVLSEVPLV